MDLARIAEIASSVQGVGLAADLAMVDFLVGGLVGLVVLATRGAARRPARAARRG